MSKVNENQNLGKSLLQPLFQNCTTLRIQFDSIANTRDQHKNLLWSRKEPFDSAESGDNDGVSFEKGFGDESGDDEGKRMKTRAGSCCSRPSPTSLTAESTEKSEEKRDIHSLSITSDHRKSCKSNTQIDWQISSHIPVDK